MNKNTKKANNKFRIHISDLSDKNEHAPIKNILVVFLFFITFVYSFLIYSYEKKIVDEMSKQNHASGPPVMEMRVKRLVKDSPISHMAPYIAREDPKTANFLVAIAKKESNWGKYSPKKGKKECYNYWGYRGTYNQTASGYSCFDSERQAVNVVGGRIEELIDQGIDTPEKMIVWKCGGSCDGHNPESVRKWIRDVDFYYNKINS